MGESIIRSRIDPEIKEQAIMILESMGLTLSEGIRMFLIQLIAQEALPFEVKSPKKITREAMTAAKNKKGLEKITVKELGEEWGVE